MTLLIVLVCISVYITGWVYAAKYFSNDDEAGALIFCAFVGFFFVPLIFYYIDYYTPTSKKPKPIKDDSDLLPF